MSIEDEITAFREILRSKPSWGALAGSEIEEILTTYIGQRGAAQKFEIERMAQEMFISRASNRDSIMARAEDEGYIPGMPQPFQNEISIKNNGLNPVSIEIRQPFISDNGTQLVVENNVTIAPSDTATLNAIQLTAEEKELPVQGVNFEEFVLGGLDDQGIFTIYEFSITIDDKAWTNEQNFKNTEYDSEVYHTLYKMTDELVIRTGNGNTGKAPAAGQILKAVIWHTNGERAYLIPDQSLVPVGTILDSNSEIANLEIKTGKIIEKGMPQEDIESVRSHVLSHIQTGAVVARNADYEFAIRKEFPELLYLKVWGEHEMISQNGWDVDHINKSFFSFLIESDNDEDIEAKAVAISNHYDTMIKPMNVISHHKQLIKKTFHVRIEGKIDRQYVISDVEDKIRSLLLDRFGLCHNTSGTVKQSDLYKLIVTSEYFRDTQEHLERKHRPYFLVELTGITETGFYDEYVYLETVTFGDGDTIENLEYVPGS